MKSPIFRGALFARLHDFLRIGIFRFAAGVGSRTRTQLPGGVGRYANFQRKKRFRNIIAKSVMTIEFGGSSE